MPTLSAGGADIFDSGYFFSTAPPDPAVCPCNLIVDLGLDGFFDPTGILSTTIEITQDSLPLSLIDLEDARFFIAMSVPVDGINTLVKPNSSIPAVPEPTTGALMLMGLMGLASGTRRLA